MEGEGKEGRQGHLSRRRWRPGPGRASLLPALRRDGLLLWHHHQRREPAQYSTSAALSSARELFRRVAVRGSERPRRTRTGRRATGVAGQMMAPGTEAPPTEPRATRPLSPPLSPPIVVCKRAPFPRVPAASLCGYEGTSTRHKRGEARARSQTHSRADAPFLCKRATLSAGPSDQPLWVRTHMYTAQAR
jgi:hypothetical protein